MDKKAIIVVTLCVLGIFFHNRWYAKKYGVKKSSNVREVSDKRGIDSSSSNQKSIDSKNPNNGSSSGENIKTLSDKDKSSIENKELSEEIEIKEQEVTLSNKYVDFVFSTKGGGLKYSEMKRHKINNENDELVRINRRGRTVLGALLNKDGNLLSSSKRCQIISSTKNSIKFLQTIKDGVKLIKIFTINQPEGDYKSSLGEEQDPYLVNLEIIFNSSDVDFQREIYMYTGSLGIINPKEDVTQTLMFYGVNDQVEKKSLTWFDGSGFWFNKKPPKSTYRDSNVKIQTAAITNQFFTIIFRNEIDKDVSIWSQKHSYELDNHNNPKKIPQAFEAAISLPSLNFSENNIHNLQYKIYAGPKEYFRIKEIDSFMTEVLDYGFLGFISKLLLKAMTQIAILVKNYGLAIIILTFILKFIMWPLHHKSTLSMKRMSKLTPLIEQLKEKYKDNPQKIQVETMGLYRQYGINPLASCLPAVIQIPFFLGFYWMLRSAVELRQEKFLWVNDLSLPDTIGYLPGIHFPINPLPLLMAGSMVLQMSLTPKTGNSTQQKIFMFMPIIFLFICYNFASALSLYWTTSNIFSIFQTLHINSLPDQELVKKPPRKKPSLKSPFLQNPNMQAKPKKKKPRRPKTG